MKTKQQDDLADLVKWTRGIEFHDENDDGIDWNGTVEPLRIWGLVALGHCS